MSFSNECKVDFLDSAPTWIDMPRLRSDDINTIKTESCTIQLDRVNTTIDPISVIGDKVNFKTESMEIGRWYPFNYQSKEHLAVRTSEKIIDIYRVKK